MIYRSSFQLGGSESAAAPALNDVARCCIEWVFDPGRRLEEPEELAANPTSSIDRRDVGSQSTVEAIFVDGSDAMRWGLRFEHPDSEDDMLFWQTDLLVRSKAEPRQTYFTCIQSRGARTDAIVPMRPVRSRPRIVQTLLEKFGGIADFPLTTDPTLLRPEAVDDFVAMLLDIRRVRPVVFVSARNVDDQTILDGRSLASWLCGLAHVFVADSRFPSLKLKEYLPERMQCWNGAIRICWPGFRKSDNPFHHRFWTPQRVREIEDRGTNGFREHILAYIADAASSSIGECFDTWGGIQAARRRQLMAELRESGQTDELVEVADETIRDLEERNQKLQGELESARSELRLYQGEAESWRRAYVNERKGVSKELGEEELAPIEDVSTAVARAQEMFADQLAFALNSVSDVEANPYEEPEKVWAALEWLGTTYYRSRTGQRSIPDFDLSLREVCGWGYQAHQSKATMSKNKRWYTTIIDGEAYWLHEHMGTGSSKDARYTIRIGFDWDEKKRIVVIGFIGQHQKTSAT